jgi:hypothetical protein
MTSIRRINAVGFTTGRDLSVAETAVPGDHLN